MTDLEKRQRIRALGDFKSQILRGFLVSEVMILGVRLEVKTLVQQEKWALSSDQLTSFALMLRAINGIPIYKFKCSKKKLEKMKRVISQFPAIVAARVYLEFNWLNRRYEESLGWFLEYLNSSESRDLWKSFKAAGMNRGLFLGEDLNKIPYSPEYVTWVRYNTEEDKHEEKEIMWSFLKLIIGSHNPDAAKKMPEKLFGRSDFNEVDNVLINPIKSDKDLVKQLNDFLEGKEDEHDRVVREMEEAWVKEVEKAKAQEEALMEERRKEEPEAMIKSSWRILE